MIDNDCLEKIKDIVSEEVPESDFSLFKSIGIFGSAALPFIRKPRDADVHCFISNDVDFATYHNAPFRLRERLRNEVSGIFANVAIHREDEYVQKDKPQLYADARKRHQLSIIRTYAYQFSPSLIINLHGDAFQNLGGIDVIGKDRDVYLKQLMWELESGRVGAWVKAHGRTKGLYHFLCGIYMVENGSHDLTDEQIANVNIAHDCADGWEELYEWTKDELRGLTDEKK